MKTLAIGSDHAGFHYKAAIMKHLRAQGYLVTDFGTDSDQPIDYPDVIRPTAQSVANGEHDGGIVLGGSGNGEAIVANKVAGIRCGVCWNTESARLTKAHNNANMIAIGERMMSEAEAILTVEAWLNAHFEGGRHQQRVAKIE